LPEGNWLKRTRWTARDLRGHPRLTQLRRPARRDVEDRGQTRRQTAECCQTFGSNVTVISGVS
jgi:hypothetical protein